jgi:urea carboxylase-associated protein 2
MSTVNNSPNSHSNVLNRIAQDKVYQTTIPGASHWSTIIRKGTQLSLKDIEGGANVGMLFFNPSQLTEKYNAPDTLKCQHTFKLTAGHCLYSEMGRIFCSITADNFGWHETICGTSHPEHVSAQWGDRDYQGDHNKWKQNGFDAFLVELAKYDMFKQDLCSNVNWFSEVSADTEGQLALTRTSKAGDEVVLRFEMDTLVVLHTCPHPLSTETEYPNKPILLTLTQAEEIQQDDICLNHCDENRRGFENNALYHFGL